MGGDIKMQLLDTLNERLDDDCNFYIRLSKPEFIRYNKYKLTTDGKCVHITINIATFPKKRINALEEIKNYLQSEIALI
jgi:RNA binding exosome subunit